MPQAAAMKNNAMQNPDTIVAAETLRLGAQGLEALAASLDERFSAALDLIVGCNGRLIISGVGKPGHVAKKIVATLASTGTPATYVHPTEASHGDLGMVTENDVVLVLSKSGESKELKDIVEYCKRFGIKLIAMTQFPKSTLGLQADVILQMPDAREACPHQLAPTTSTTVMIAFGDALAMALMQRRGFSATDFRQYHPGGKLGGQLLAVAKIMHTGEELPLVPDTATVETTQRIMSASTFGCAIVINKAGELAGFVSDGDIRRHLSNDLLQKNVSVVIGTATPRTIAHDALAAAALALMNQYNITQLVVVENNKPVGLVRLHDILRAGVA